MGSVGFNGEDESQPSTSSGKKYKLPRTILDGCGAVNHASIPRKLRSAIKKRGRETVTIPLPISRKKFNASNGVETLGKYSAKKSKRNKKQGKMTKDEEEVAEALYALSGMFSDSNKANQPQLQNELSEAKSPAILKAERLMNSVEGSGIPRLKDQSNKIDSTAETVKSQSLVDAQQIELPSRKQQTAPIASGFQSDSSLVQRPRLSTSGEPAIELQQAAASGIQYDKNYYPVENKNNGLFTSPPQSSKSQGSRKRIPAWIQKTNSNPTIENTTEKYNTQDAVEPSKSWKRCTAHMYISRLIKVLQLSERNEGLLENKPTQAVITRDDRNDGASFGHSAEIQNDLLIKRPVQDRPESSASCSRKQSYNFLALGTGFCGLDGRKGVNGAGLSYEVNEQFHVQPQNNLPMFFLPPQNGYSSTFHGHNSPLAAQQVQIPQYLNSSFTSQLQTWYNNGGGGGGGPHLSDRRNGGRDAPSMLNYAHTIFPHVHAATALGSKYQQFPSPHQQIMTLSNVKKHHQNQHHQDHLRLGFERNAAAFCPENIPQFQLPCNQRL